MVSVCACAGRAAASNNVESNTNEKTVSPRLRGFREPEWGKLDEATAAAEAELSSEERLAIPKPPFASLGVFSLSMDPSLSAREVKLNCFRQGSSLTPRVFHAGYGLLICKKLAMQSPL
jgi:hypothetical protein